MRRKSTRNAQKATPDKLAKETESPKTRRSKRRKRSPSKSSESEDESFTAKKRGEPEETPDTTTKSHTPTDDETSEEPMWKVTSSEDAPQGEIQKLKLCLTRPPDSPDKSKTRRNKSSSQTEDDATSSEDKSSTTTTTTRRTRSRGSPLVRNDGLSRQEGDEDMEDKKGKGKSKGKHKSKIEKSPHVSEPEIQTNNEISENVQVTPQSPSIDKPVDNESDYNKVDDDVIQNVNENTQKQGNNGEESASNDVHDSNINQDEDVKQLSNTEDNATKDSDDDEPLSVIQKNISAQQENVSENDTKEPPPSEDQQMNEIATSTEEVQQEAVQKDVCETSTQPEPETSVEPQDSSEQNVKTDNTDNEEVQLPQSLPTEESIEDSPTEKVVLQEEPSEAEQQHSAEENLPSQEIEENNSTDDNEPKRVRLESETVSETVSEAQVSPSRTPEASSFTEKVQEDQERPPRRRLRRNNHAAQLDSNNTAEEIRTEEEPTGIRPHITKRKWESGLDITSSLIKIDLESIQVVWPSIDFPEEPDLNLDTERERRKSVAESSGKKLERKVSIEYKSDSSEKPSYEKQSSVSSLTQDSEDNSNIIAFNRKISIVDDTASKLRPPPSPAKNPVSDVLYITNLVRPFTLKQLKELLERTGKIQEEGFWTDRIKSKCYVQYETIEEAEATRNALHGVQWPIGNGKKLIIDYANVEDLQNAKNPPPPPVVAAPVVDVKTAVKENVEPVENKRRSEEKIIKEVEKKKSEGPVREWDIGKKDVRRERSRSRERSRKHRRSPSPSDDFISRKQRKAEESVPQKLMDDLFLKTKATPSIYWQPLSPEEISMKQQQRLIRMEEHKRRMEENSRMKGRDMGRGAFRRRYD